MAGLRLPARGKTPVFGVSDGAPAMIANGTFTFNQKQTAQTALVHHRDNAQKHFCSQTVHKSAPIKIDITCKNLPPSRYCPQPRLVPSARTDKPIWVPCG